MKIDACIGWRGACAAAVVLAYTPTSFGQDVASGWEGSSGRGYAFVSPSTTLHRSGQVSLILNGSVNYLYYDIPGTGGDAKVRSPGQSLGLGLRYTGTGFTATVGPGYEIRQTRRTLAGGGVAQENERGLTLAGSVFVQATPRTVISLLGNYGKANDYYWMRGGVKQQVSGFRGGDATGWHVGAELTNQGNKDVKSSQLGVVLESSFPQAKASLQLRAGGSRRANPDGSRVSEPYFGVGLYKSF